MAKEKKHAGRTLIYQSQTIEIWYAPKTGKYYCYEKGKLVGVNYSGQF